MLVVDDDPELLEFLQGELATEGYACAAAASGQAALLAFRQQAWDLVLLDWGLPDFSGVEVCERLRAGGSTTPVLMLTAHDEVAERVRALDAGADDYLIKRFFDRRTAGAGAGPAAPGQPPWQRGEQLQPGRSERRPAAP